MQVTDCLLLIGPGELDPTKLQAKEAELQAQGIERIVVRGVTDAPGGSASAIKAVEEAGFMQAFFVVLLGSPSVDLSALVQAHRLNWGIGVQAVGESGQPVGVFLFEYRIFDYIPRHEPCEIQDLLERLREQDEPVVAVSVV